MAVKSAFPSLNFASLSNKTSNINSSHHSSLSLFHSRPVSKRRATAVVWQYHGSGFKRRAKVALTHVDKEFCTVRSVRNPKWRTAIRVQQQRRADLNTTL